MTSLWKTWLWSQLRSSLQLLLPLRPWLPPHQLLFLPDTGPTSLLLLHKLLRPLCVLLRPLGVLLRPQGVLIRPLGVLLRLLGVLLHLLGVPYLLRRSSATDDAAVQNACSCPSTYPVSCVRQEGSLHSITLCESGLVHFNFGCSIGTV